MRCRGTRRHRLSENSVTLVQALLALTAGGLIGLVLGLVGGGGSILAVPLLVYAVGVGSTHAAIGTAKESQKFALQSWRN